MFTANNIRKIFRRFGPPMATLSATAFIAGCSMLLCAILSLAFWGEVAGHSLIKAFAIPAVITPAISYFLLQFLSNLDLAEENLRKSEEKYRNVLLNIEEGYYEVDLKGGFTFHNETMRNMLGYDDNEMSGLNFRRYLDRRYADKVIRVGKEVYRTGKAAKAIDWRLIRKNKETLHIEASISLMMDRDGAPVGFRGIVRDITERKVAEENKRILEERLQNSRRLESLGALAGGIAHDFNNLLMGIQGNVSLMLLEIGRDNSNFEKLKQIESSVEKGAMLTRQLLGFAREEKFKVESIDPKSVMESTALVFARTHRNISIRSEFEENGWMIEADRSRLEQVLISVFVNAGQAMPHGGELRLSTTNEAVFGHKAERIGLVPGNYVKLSVGDSGRGIDDGLLSRIFDPFFSTRSIGRGNGLGLTYAYGVVRNHNGIIKVSSVRGNGSTFDIYFPAAPPRIETEQAAAPPAAPLSGTETILIVDDEEIVLEVGAEMLKSLGYDIRKAKNGNEAIEKFMKEKDGIDLVILDLIMPELDGYRTFDILKTVNGDTRVLFSSGCGLPPPGELVKGGSRNFIRKPFNLDELSSKVRSVLDA